MKRVLVSLAFACSACSMCGYEQLDSELIGQVKKVAFNTPLLCPNYTSADISLGVMRNGVGSMSTQDVWVTITNDRQYQALSSAVESGKIVKARTNVRRATICIPDHVLTSVEVLP